MLYFFLLFFSKRAQVLQRIETEEFMGPLGSDVLMWDHSEWQIKWRRGEGDENTRILGFCLSRHGERRRGNRCPALTSGLALFPLPSFGVYKMPVQFSLVVIFPPK